MLRRVPPGLLGALPVSAELRRPRGCVAGLANGFGGTRSEQELGGTPGTRAAPRRRCASESSLSSSSGPLCDSRWAQLAPPPAFSPPPRSAAFQAVCLVELKQKWEVQLHKNSVYIMSSAHTLAFVETGLGQPCLAAPRRPLGPRVRASQAPPASRGGLRGSRPALGDTALLFLPKLQRTQVRPGQARPGAEAHAGGPQCADILHRERQLRQGGQDRGR